MKRARLVSILGLGPEKAPPHYQETVYGYGGAKSEPTPLVDRALMTLFEPAGLFMVGTPEVEERWIATGLFARLVERPFAFRQAPQGGSDTERWSMFSIFRDALSLSAVADAGETEPPDGFIIDITHGFRIQPVFLMSALAFTFSEWAWEGVTPLPVRIVYGAYEARHAGVAPIWDLTEYLTVSRWNGALDAFLRYGRADELEALSKDSSDISLKAAAQAGEKGAAMAVHAFLRHLGAQARQVADDLALVRTRDLLTKSAPRLLQMLEQPNCLTWLDRLPVLRGGVELLKTRMRSLAVTSTIDREGLMAESALTDLYLLLQRFSEAAVTLREGLITHYGLEHEDLVEQLKPPGDNGCWAGRNFIEKRWNVEVQLKQNQLPDPEWPEPVRLNIALSREFQQAGNDIEHGGFNDSPSSSRRLREKLTDAARSFRQLAGEATRTERPVPPSTGFINLSNHPVSSWSEAQRDEAVALGFGDPVDLPDGMPLVPAEATEDQIVQMAADIVAQVDRARMRGAFVSTDPTLTFAIVARLQRRGIVCFSTRSPRQAHERVLSDGSIEKTSRFVFSGWRRYPYL